MTEKKREKNRSTRSPANPRHGMDWDQTRVSVVRSREITTSAMVRPHIIKQAKYVRIM